MKFGTQCSRPSSSRELLYKQVEEQSDSCDVTVQVGKWKKKFHWCVLVDSPFFECIQRSNFIEKQTGLVKLNIATPLTTETTMLFLYGIKPRLTEENVRAVLELSEFLLIPNLNSACVAFVKNLQITEENCMKLLEMSSIFNFELLYQGYDYIRGHLHTILQKEDAIYLTKESVLMLLRDPLLSYVSAEENFRFAIRWANARQHSNASFQEIFKEIDLESIDEEFLNTVVKQHPLVSAIADVNLAMYSGDTHQIHRVLVFPWARAGTRIACFDLENERWCGIETDFSDNSGRQYSITYAPIEGTLGTGQVYRVLIYEDSFTLCSQDLRSKVCTSKILPNAEDICLNEFCTYGFSKDVFVLVWNGSKRWLQSKNITKHHQLLDTTTAYFYQLNKPEATLCPLFTLQHSIIRSVCINENNLIALYSHICCKRTLYIYDISNCLLDEISMDFHLGPDLAAQYSDFRIAATDGGFCFYNKSVVIIITRQTGPERYEVQRCDLEQHDRQVNYNIANNRCFRLLERTCNNEIEFSFARYEELMSVTAQEVEWEPLSPPPDVLQRVSQGEDAFMMKFPRSMLRCHFDCPHCKQLT